MRLARRGRAWYTGDKKITAGALKLSGGRLELPAEMCHIVLFSGGSCTVQCGDMSLLVSPGCALLLGPGAWVVSQAGHTQQEMLGCEFPLAVLHEMKNATGVCGRCWR